ncbi:MAG: hypothetical protein MUC49_19595 [Raineya sp.]|jgi:hypothetical protein|nr:hypothetical protein [Raineya sp.]
MIEINLPQVPIAYKEYSKENALKEIKTILYSKIYQASETQGRRNEMELLEPNNTVTPDYIWQIMLFDTSIYNRPSLGFKYRTYESISKKIPEYEFGSVPNPNNSKKLDFMYTMLVGSLVRIPLSNPKCKNIDRIDTLDRFGEIVLIVKSKLKKSEYRNQVKKLLFNGLSMTQQLFNRNKKYINFYVLDEYENLPKIISEKPIIINYELTENKGVLSLIAKPKSSDIKTTGDLIMSQSIDSDEYLKQSFTREELLNYPSQIFAKIQIVIISIMALNGLTPY